MASQWTATPTTFGPVGGPQATTKNPIESLYKVMLPGQIAELAAGDYPNVKLGGPPVFRPRGSWPITIRGAPLATPTTLKRRTNVGGSDTLVLNGTAGKLGASDVKFSRLFIEADDHAGIFCEKGGFKNITFNLCRIVGRFDAHKPFAVTPNDGDKWGLRTYDSDNLVFEEFVGSGIFDEHMFYVSQIAGDHRWSGFDIKHCGRTAFQIVNRPPPDGTNPGVGNLLWERGKITDVCLEKQGGGSAFHLAGGMPDTKAEIRDVQLELGCDPDLAKPYQGSITGAMACKDGNPTFPGGIKELRYTRFSTKIGLVYPGVGGARRSGHLIGNCELFAMEDCYFEQGPQAHPIALEILGSAKAVQISGVNEVRGRVKFKGTEYMTWQAFENANPALFDAAHV